MSPTNLMTEFSVSNVICLLEMMEVYFRYIIKGYVIICACSRLWFNCNVVMCPSPPLNSPLIYAYLYMYTAISR